MARNPTDVHFLAERLHLGHLGAPLPVGLWDLESAAAEFATVHFLAAPRPRSVRGLTYGARWLDVTRSWRQWQLTTFGEVRWSRPYLRAVAHLQGWPLRTVSGTYRLRGWEWRPGRGPRTDL